ncbi:kinase-like domain-containing protein [Nemania sp. NC0429]|nr:kinase-like domain-containing protein [Nemania sp. NC0429]
MLGLMILLFMMLSLDVGLDLIVVCVVIIHPFSMSNAIVVVAVSRLSLSLFWLKRPTHGNLSKLEFLQVWIREKLQGRVPVPEVFGWAEDQGQIFIYMDLIDGDPLNERWPSMMTEERLGICAELRSAVSAWRDLRQDEGACYVGSINKQPLTDIFFTLNMRVVGPFEGEDAVKQFQDAMHIDVAHPGPVVFTHNDFVACNILVAKNSPSIAAIIDWGQSGWFPAYWEYCKARYVNVPDDRFFKNYEKEWEQEYLPQIIGSVDEAEVWYPFLFFALSKI